MGRHLSMAFWTFVTPIVTTRSFRIGLALFGFAALGLIALFLSGLFSERFMTAALESARHLLIMLGMPVAAVLCSEMALRDGISHRTLLYPLLGPTPRTTLALVRTVVSGLFLAAGSVLLLVLIRLLLRDGLEFLTREALALGLGSLAYTSLFGVLHLVSRRGLITGLVILFFFDFPLGKVPFAIRNLSPSYHVGVIANQQEQLALPIQLALPETSLILSVSLLVAIATLFTFASTEIFRRKNLGELC